YGRQHPDIQAETTARAGFCRERPDLAWRTARLVCRARAAAAAPVCFIFLGDLHRTLTQATVNERRTIEEFQQVLRGLGKSVDRPGLGEARAVLDRMNLVLATRQAAEEFHLGWQARMGLKAKPGVSRAHWRTTRTLTRRMGEGWGDEYLGLNPL